MKTVEDILKEKGRQVWGISPHATILEALRLMAEKDVGALVVVEDDQIMGIISERDYARKIALRGKSSVNTPVKEIMTNKVYYVSPKATIQECLALITQQSIRHLPVLENGKLVGLISIGDVVKSIIDEQEITITQLSDYITGKYM
ncbi:MAG: histidine kinase [Anaerolineae bacterium CG_4_9_14_0_8_um_filter_58_9]|nr:MAG: histidine kinase [Anaerolineae bacterium CG_4_9_14_0_8_um_filter_58_9]